jgi:hypothetical protein
MTVIVPDEDEEFANRRKRNRCEYFLKRGGRGGSLGAFSSSCMVVACRESVGKRKRRSKKNHPDN